jgi:hypothetical protein
MTSAGEDPGTTTPTPPASSGAPLTVRTVKSKQVRGTSTITTSLPVFAGPLAAEVNRRVQRSADDGIGPAEADSTIDVIGEVTVNNGRTVQVVLSYSFYAEGAAHPTDSVSTVVLRRADAHPILLTDVLSQTTPALTAALKYGTAFAKKEGSEDPALTLTNKVKDWADWQADAKGMSFYFDDYQAGSHAAGLRELDVPWSVLRSWVRDDAYALLSA